MKIVYIDWLSLESKEAFMHVDSCVGEFVVFCHPCSYCISDNVVDGLYCMSVGNVAVTAGRCGIFMNNEGSCIVRGVVDGIRDVVVGSDVRVEVDVDLGCGFKVGDLVQFSCGRIDVL